MHYVHGYNDSSHMPIFSYLGSGKPLPNGSDQGGLCSCSLSILVVYLFPESWGCVVVAGRGACRDDAITFTRWRPKKASVDAENGCHLVNPSCYIVLYSI